MSKKLEAGETITCSGYADMRDVQKELTKRGYKVSIGIGYTVRIESVPEPDQVEQDEWITWEL